MAAVADIPNEASAAAANKIKNLDSKPNSGNPKADPEFNVQKLVDMFTKLNPLAKEFIPSSYSPKLDHHLKLSPGTNFLTKNLSSDNLSSNRRVLTIAFSFDLLNYLSFLVLFG